MSTGQPTLQQIFQKIKASFEAAGVDEAALDARLLLEHHLNMTPEKIFLENNRIISSSEEITLTEMAARRLAGEPVSKIIGQRGFWKYDFKVSRETLDPRADSEILIETALRRCPPAGLIIDAGTGTGCLLLSLLGEWPTAQGIGLDISPAAAAVARENAAALGMAARARIETMSWTDYAGSPADLLISNPPYIAEGERAGMSREVLDYDPPQALFAGADGLDAYRSLVGCLPQLLKPAGFVILEIGYQQADAVTALLRAASVADIELGQDLGGRDRVLSGRYSP